MVDKFKFIVLNGIIKAYKKKQAVKLDKNESMYENVLTYFWYNLSLTNLSFIFSLFYNYVTISYKFAKFFKQFNFQFRKIQIIEYKLKNCKFKISLSNKTCISIKLKLVFELLKWLL